MACFPIWQNFSADARKSSASESRTRTWGSEAMRKLCCRFEERASRRAQEPELIVGDDLDRHDFHKMAQTAFGEKRFQKHGCGELGKNFWRDAAGEEDAASGFDLECEVPRLRTKNRDKDIQRLLTHGTLPFQSSVGDGCCSVAFHHFRDQPVRRFAFPGVTQKFENVDQPRSR